MGETYEAPEFEILNCTEDIVCASGDPDNIGGGLT